MSSGKQFFLKTLPPSEDGKVRKTLIYHCRQCETQSAIKELSISTTRPFLKQKRKDGSTGSLNKAQSRLMIGGVCGVCGRRVKQLMSNDLLCLVKFSQPKEKPKEEEEKPKEEKPEEEKEKKEE